MEAVLGALGKSTYLKRNVPTNKYFLLPVKDLEGAPTEELGDIPTPTRTTGREIDLLLRQGCSGARTVMGHATGMTVTVVGADVNRSKHDMIWVSIPPPVIRCKSNKKSSWFIGPYAICNSPLFFFH